MGTPINTTYDTLRKWIWLIPLSRFQLNRGSGGEAGLVPSVCFSFALTFSLSEVATADVPVEAFVVSVDAKGMRVHLRKDACSSDEYIDGMLVAMDSSNDSLGAGGQQPERSCQHDGIPMFESFT
jgi:hypothetical protein